MFFSHKNNEILMWSNIMSRRQVLGRYKGRSENIFLPMWNSLSIDDDTSVLGRVMYVL